MCPALCSGRCIGFAPSVLRDAILAVAMRSACVFLAAVASLPGQTATQTTLIDPPAESSGLVLVSLGLTDTEPTAWDGSLQVESGKLLALIGREFPVGGVSDPQNRWKASSRPGFEISRRLMYEQHFSTPDEVRILEPSLYAFWTLDPQRG